MSAEKHHYRTVYKSDHLGIADLEEMLEQGKRLVFTIKQVRQEKGVSVAGKKGDHNIAYFADANVKPWVLNAGNAKIVKGFAGNSPFVEDWQNIPVELYIDATVKMKGEVVGGVRITPIQPKLEPVAKPAFTKDRFEAAKKANATVERIKETYTLSPELEKEYLEYVGAKNA